jgi:hypothetical protein
MCLLGQPRNSTTPNQIACSEEIIIYCPNIPVSSMHTILSSPKNEQNLWLMEASSTDSLRKTGVSCGEYAGEL